MRKRIVLLLSLTMVLMMSAVAFAADQEPVKTEDPIEEYTTTTRHYQESLNGTWYYAVKDRNYYGLTQEYEDREDDISARGVYYTQDVSDPAADLSKKYEYSQDAYRYAGWYEVHEDGSETLYAFVQPVMHNTKLRLHWKQLGTYYIRYDAGSGTLDDQDNNEDTFHTLDGSDYTDHANIVVTRTANAPDGMSFVGWKIRGGDGFALPGENLGVQSRSAGAFQHAVLRLDQIRNVAPQRLVGFPVDNIDKQIINARYPIPEHRLPHFLPVSSAEPLSPIQAASDFFMNLPSVVSISSTFS